MAVDAQGRPVRVLLSPGHKADIDCAPALIADLPAEAVVADKGYDADPFVAQIEASGAEAVIPPRSHRRCPRAFDRQRYRARQVIERFFARLKQFQSIATRYDKLVSSFLAFIHLACAIIWLS